MLEIRDLVVGYGGPDVIDGLSLDVAGGEFIAVLGSNGAGKSTLLKTISGLLRPRGGTIRLGDERIDGWSAARVVDTGVVHCPEGRRVFPEMTVLENLMLGATLRRSGERERLDRVYELFPRLRERRSQAAASLSGGEQQMLALGRSLMGDPKLLMLDEPSLGLAPTVVDLVFDAVTQIREEGLTLLLVEQNAELALELTDRAYVIERGRVVAEGPSSELAQSERIRHIYLGMEEEVRS
jgi:branched-chain amino acid transport system ATP-binding protein